MAPLVSREHLQRQLRAWVDEGRLVKAAQTCFILRGQPVRGTSNLLGAYAVLLFTPPDTLQGVQSVAVTLDLFPSVRPPEGGGVRTGWPHTQQPSSPIYFPSFTVAHGLLPAR
jgi:hypothetical protein